jgi:O-acetyl-ADP-ribose deacetylase (regulator of RNase III)
MPVDVCAYQYAYAVISASSKVEGSSLKEIHFIDVDDKVVMAMKQIFSSIFSGSNDAVPPLSLSINSASVRPIVDPTPTGSLGFDGRVSPDFPKSHTYQRGGVVCHEYHLTSDFSVQVYTGNIVKSATNGIVCTEDKELKHEGEVSKALFGLGGKEAQINVEKCKECNPRPGDVFVVDAGRNFDETVYIFMVVSPVLAESDSEEQWLESVNACLTKVLQRASQCQVYNIAMPLMGTSKLKYTFIKALIISS